LLIFYSFSPARATVACLLPSVLPSNPQFALPFPASRFTPPASPFPCGPACQPARGSAAIPHSEFRIPHSTLEKFRIRHSAFHIGMIPHSAFRIPHWDDSTFHISEEFRIRNRTLVPSYALGSLSHSAFIIPHSAFKAYPRTPLQITDLARIAETFQPFGLSLPANRRRQMYG
jgi:hypothetical protein